jgi:beta-N-acetylhexosaminidase
MKLRSWSDNLEVHFSPFFQYHLKSIIYLLLLSIFVVVGACSRKTTQRTTVAAPPVKEKTSEVKNNPPRKTPGNKSTPVPDSKAKTVKVSEQINYLKSNSSWVDSVFNTLTPEERIAQLIMFDAYSFKGKAHLDTLMKLVKLNKIGGLIFLKGGPGRQINMINALQEASKVPLLIAMDAEYGIGMRLDSTNKYPFQMTLGAIQDNNLIYEMGRAIANDVKRVGMQVNFAPVLDINNNPENPVIGIRSFGENKEAVTAKSLAYMKGLQDNKVLATAKHFPGHGDTDVDSHRDLPLITASKERLDTLELYPFRELIKEGLGGVMVAHMNVPALDNTDKLPSTLSKPIITGVLKEQLGFKGVIFTDAMVMEGLAKYYPSGVAEPMAVISGNDILEKMKNARVAISSIKKAVERGEISQDEIDERCRKILAVKEWTGLNKYKPISTKNLYADLKSPASDSLMLNLIRSSATLLKNQDNVVPLTKSTTSKVASISFNSNGLSTFQTNLDQKVKSEHFSLTLKSSAASIKKVKEAIKDFDLVVLAIYDTRSWPMFKLNYPSTLLSFINEVIESGKGIVVHFGNAYALNDFPALNEAKGILMMYENSLYTERVASEIITGKVKPKGKLPVTINEQLPYGFGL